MVTSFLGMSWTMFDFLADGLKINPHGKVDVLEFIDSRSIDIFRCHIS